MNEDIKYKSNCVKIRLKSSFIVDTQPCVVWDFWWYFEIIIYSTPFKKFHFLSRQWFSFQQKKYFYDDLSFNSKYSTLYSSFLCFSPPSQHPKKYIFIYFYVFLYWMECFIMEVNSKELLWKCFWVMESLCDAIQKKFEKFFYRFYIH